MIEAPVKREVQVGKYCPIHGLPAEEQVEFIRKVLSINNGFSDPYAGMWESITWRTDDEYAPISFWANANDLFYWACADGEDITPDNFHLLKEAVDDIATILGASDPQGLYKAGRGGEWQATWDLWQKVGSYASDLFCCRSRKMRPQQPCYKRYPDEIKLLFDACGPERDRKSEG